MSIFTRKDNDPGSQHDEPDRSDDREAVRTDVPPDEQVVDRGDQAGDQRAGEYSGADDLSRGAAREGHRTGGEAHDPAREHDTAREHPGGSTPAAGAAAGAPSASGDTTAAERATTAGGGDGQPERLVPRERADAYSARWDSAKSTFVDEPRTAVAQADALVGELLDEMQRLFGEQRRRLEEGLDADTTSTEDLRLALRRYRSFFDRLVSF